MSESAKEDPDVREADAVLVSGLGDLGSRQSKDDNSTPDVISSSTQLTNRVMGRVHGACSGTYYNDSAVLLVVEYTFIQRHVKIRQANIEMSFDSRVEDKKKSNHKTEPVVCVICPSQLYGSPSAEDQKLNVEGGADIGASEGPAQAKATVNASKEVSSQRHHQTSITGDLDCDEYHDVPNKAFFEVKANSVEDAFPRIVFLAVVVKQRSDLSAQIDVWLNNSKWLSRLWWREDPLPLPVGVKKGSLSPASTKFETLSVENWKDLVPFRGDREVPRVIRTQCDRAKRRKLTESMYSYAIQCGQCRRRWREEINAEWQDGRFANIAAESIWISMAG